MKRPKRLIMLALLVGLLGLFVLGTGSEHDPSFQLSTSTERSVASIQHEVFVGNAAKPVLIVCEENHASLEVQRNCQLAIEELKTAGIRPVLLAEGTSPTWIELSEIFNVGSPSFRLAATEAWFELGWLSGIEMAALQGSSLPLFGVEDLNLKAEHEEELSREIRAWYDLCKELDSLLQEFPGEISLDCADRSAQGFHFPQNLESEFPQIHSALERARQAEAAFEQPVGGALPLQEATRILQQKLNQGTSVREALAELQQDFSGARLTFSTRYAEWGESLDGLYDTIINSARQAGLDVSKAEELHRTYHRRQAEADTAGNERHGPIVANAQQALTSEGSKVGILAIGAAHTAHLKEVLRDQAISYLVVTPDPLGLRLFTTPRRERESFQRNSRENPPPTPLESWLRGAIKPELILADPEKQEALATDIALVRGIHRALRGEIVDVPAGLLIKDFSARSIPEGMEISVEAVSGRQLRLQFPSGFKLTEVTAKQLIRHLMEALDARNWLKPRDHFFSPATHIYFEPMDGGFRGGAFISYMLDGDTLSMKTVQFEIPRSIDEMIGAYRDTLRRSLGILAANPNKVRNRQPADLFAPLTILDPVVAVFKDALDELGVPEGQIVPIVLRLAPVEGQNVSSLREVDFTLLATLARLSGVEGYERRLLFVNSGLEPDSDWIRVGGWERPLPTVLANVHRWASTAKHIAVFTIPTTAKEWEGNPYAEYLEAAGWTHEEYVQDILPYVRNAIEAIGLENVVEPLTQGELFAQLEAKLQDARDAAITLTLVAHRQEGQEPVIHFKKEGNVPLKDVLEGLMRLQKEGKIPGSAQLEFNVLVCSIGREGAEGFLKQLGARLVLGSPHAIGLATNSVLLARLASKMKEEGKPLYQAHFEAQEEILREVLTKSLDELDQQGIHSLDMPGPMARKEDLTQKEKHG